MYHIQTINNNPSFTDPVAVVRVTLAVLSADAVGLVLMSLGVIVTKTHSRSCRGNTQDCLVSPKLVIWEVRQVALLINVGCVLLFYVILDLLI